MKNINLLVSTSRYNEVSTKAELWFSLLICGDKYPIIYDLEYSGLIAALSNLEVRVVISKLRSILNADPNFFQYILKIIPIDLVCNIDLELISKIIEENYRNYIKKEESFRILLKRRKNEQIDRNNMIKVAAKKIDNKVNLENPDVTIRIELLGNFCGISFLRKGEILKLNNERKKINHI